MLYLFFGHGVRGEGVRIRACNAFESFIVFTNKYEITKKTIFA